MQICEGKRKDSRYFVRHKLFCYLRRTVSEEADARTEKPRGVFGGRGGWGGGGGGWGSIPNATLSPGDFCTKTDSDESNFNAPLIVSGKGTRQCP